MGYEYEGLVILLDGVFQYGDYLAAVLAVKVSRGLISQYELGLVDQSPCECHTLLLTARELVGEVTALAFKSRKTQQLIKILHIGRSVVQIEGKNYILLNIEHGYEVEVLEDEAYAPAAVG